MKVRQQNLAGMIQSGLNLITQAISIHDPDLRLIHANQRFQSMFLIPEELTRPGTDFRTLITYLAERGEYGPVDDAKLFIDEKVALAQRFEPHYFERTRANGTSISVEGSPLDGGGWISVYTDITDIKEQEALFRSRADDLSKELLARSEALSQTNRELSATVRALETAKLELTESREQLDLLNRMTPAHIAHVDADGVYTQSNGRLPSVIPFADSDVVGRPFREVLGDEIWEHVRTRFDTVLSGAPSVSEFRDEESGRFVRLAMSPDMDGNGAVKGAYLLSTDVTDEALARHALAHARRKELATQLTSVMAHDFSNLLTIIMGQQDKLALASAGDTHLTDISDTIKAAANRGRELIEHLNQIDTQRNVEAVPVKSSAFMTGLEQLARAALPEGIALSFDTDVPDDVLVLDPGFAQDAVLNLVINAAEACSGTGTVGVQIGRAGKTNLEFIVTDNGPGFSEEGLTNALVPFYSTKSGKVGRGLGLTSAFDFAKSCGGTLRIRNRETGGAAVTIRIPYQTASDEKRLVLLVDDDDTVRKTVRDQLRRAGHTVIEATSVDEARKLMTIDGLSLVISDLDLGAEGTGVDVVAEVPRDIPRLIITGLPLSDQRRQKAEETCEVLVKPFDFDSLQSAIARLPV